MAEPFFMSQAQLESSLEKGELAYQDGTLSFSDGRSIRVEPGLKVLGLVDGNDEAGLVGRILTLAEVQAHKGEHYRDSLIVGETAYQCEEGYVGPPQETSQAAPAPQAADASAQPSSDTDLLADFLLKNL